MLRQQFGRERDDVMPFEHVQVDYQSYNIPMPGCRQNDLENEAGNGNRQIEARMFFDEKMRGVFFSYTYNGTLRVYTTLDDDTDAYNEEISQLLQSSIYILHTVTNFQKDLKR